MTYCKTALFCWNTGNGDVRALESFNHQNVAADLFVIYLVNYLFNNWTYLCAANGHCQQEQHSHTWRHLEGWEESQDGRTHTRTHTHGHTDTFSRFSFQFFGRLRKLKVKTVQNLSSYHFAGGGGKVCAQLFWVSESSGVWGASVGWRNVKSTEEFAPSVGPPLLSSPPHYFHRGQWGGRLRRRAKEGGA